MVELAVLAQVGHEDRLHPLIKSKQFKKILTFGGAFAPLDFQESFALVLACLYSLSDGKAKEAKGLAISVSSFGFFGFLTQTLSTERISGRPQMPFAFSFRSVSDSSSFRGMKGSQYGRRNLLAASWYLFFSAAARSKSSANARI